MSTEGYAREWEADEIEYITQGLDANELKKLRPELFRLTLTAKDKKDMQITDEEMAVRKYLQSRRAHYRLSKRRLEMKI